MWDLPEWRIEPVSPALAGRFLTTEPPGKSHLPFYYKQDVCILHSSLCIHLILAKRLRSDSPVHSEGGKPRIEVFSQPPHIVLTPQLNKELGFWKQYSMWCFFLAISNNFFFWPDYSYVHFGVKKREHWTLEREVKIAKKKRKKGKTTKGVESTMCRHRSDLRWTEKKLHH